MRTIIPNLNYIHVLAVAVAGFMLGWLWYGPLFGKAWMAEMKITEAMMKEKCVKRSIAPDFIFLFTLLGSFGLAALIAAHGAPNWKHGAAYGAFIGVFAPMVQLLKCAVWEERSIKLQAINAGHLFVLYAMQGAILGAWH